MADNNIYEYDIEKQSMFITFLLSCEDVFVRCQNILTEDYFDAELKPVVRYMIDYSNNYKTLPMPEQVRAETKTDIEILDSDKVTEQHKDWFVETFENFCRHKALENAIVNAPSKIQKGEYGKVEKDVKEAMLVSLQKDLGTDLFSSPSELLANMRDRKAIVSTGWDTLDYKLYGGMNPGEITIFAGNSGVGKSLFLQNLCINWALNGRDVVYFTFELSEELVALRLYAMLSGYSTKEIWKNIDDMELKVKFAGKNAGSIKLKYMTSPSSNDLRAYIKEYEIQNGKKPEGIAVDYIDIMRPNDSKVNPSDMFVKDKFVTEELRGLAADMNILCGTASQLNRSAINEQEFDQSHIAGGISKINTCDNLLAIEQSSAMKERGEYRLHFVKTRSSPAVGSKISMAYDNTTLRITDNDDETGKHGSAKKETQSQKAEDIRNQLKKGNSSNSENTNSPESSNPNTTRKSDLKKLIQDAKEDN